MSRETQKSPHTDRLQGEVPGQENGPSSEADDADAPPDVRPVARPKPGGQPSEDDQVEAGFDNMPV